MAIHKKNLLEAFQASAAAEKGKAPVGSTTGSSKAGGPFASPSAVSDAPLATPAKRWSPDKLQRMLALFIVLCVAAFFIGRATVNNVRAKEPRRDKPELSGNAREDRSTKLSPGAAEESGRPAAAAAPAGASTAKDGAAPSDARSEPEKALVDPANRYTIKLVEYRKGRDDKIASQTLAWLLEQKLPAVAHYSGSRLYIFLGAAPKSADLEDMRDRAKAMTGPPPLNKPAEFHDAYIVKIDQLISR